jgi:hypothetical protein
MRLVLICLERISDARAAVEFVEVRTFAEIDRATTTQVTVSRFEGWIA